MIDFVTRLLTMEDGVRLEAKIYEGGSKTPALCLPGLTRNAKDFSEFAPAFAATGRRVVALSFRGRGGSDRDRHYLNYRPEIYAQDAIAALDALKIARAVFVGTSLGGIATMLAHERAPGRVAAAIVNDVGPTLAPEGLARIAGYVGAATGDHPIEPDLAAAAAKVKAINETAFPQADDSFWLTFARRTYREVEGGWTLDYDPNIARAFAETGPAPDLWPAWRALAATPTLLTRGEISDLLTAAIAAEMAHARPGLIEATAAGVGHAPFLTEPDLWPAIERFVGALD